MNEVAAKSRTIDVPPYLVETAELLKAKQADLWAWFSSTEFKVAQAEAVSLDLLKSAEPVSADLAPRLHDATIAAAESLDLDWQPKIFKTKQSAKQINLAISVDPEQPALIVQGDLEERLEDNELLACLAHELCHLILWRKQNGDLLVASNLLNAMTGQGDVDPLKQTASFFNQFTEIFCDRGALSVCGRIHPVISSLVKIQTEQQSVDASEFLKRTKKEWKRSKAEQKETKKKHTQMTHPVVLRRVLSLDHWNSNGKKSESKIEQIICGDRSLGRLDLLNQVKAQQFTRRLVEAVMEPAWMQGSKHQAHAELYFADYEPRATALAEFFEAWDQTLKQFAVFVLLDFVSADRDLLEPALAHAIQLSERSGFKDQFIDKARKELRLRKKQIQEIESQADQLFAKAMQTKRTKLENSSLKKEESAE